jgi:hypothetical protein
MNPISAQKWPCLLLLLFFTYACSPIQVLDQEPAENFSLSNYRTFNFYEIDAAGDSLGSKAYQNGIASLKTEIRQQLQKRGLQLGEHDPDLLVNIGIVIKADVPRYIVQKHYRVESEEALKYTEGTVSVHLVDRVTNKLVWRGAVEGVVPDRPASLQRNVADAMEVLFKGI